jgi:hypothetical protein
LDGIRVGVKEWYVKKEEHAVTCPIMFVIVSVTYATSKARRGTNIALIAFTEVSAVPTISDGKLKST